MREGDSMHIRHYWIFYAVILPCTLQLAQQRQLFKISGRQRLARLSQSTLPERMRTRMPNHPLNLQLRLLQQEAMLNPERRAAIRDDIEFIQAEQKRIQRAQ